MKQIWKIVAKILKFFFAAFVVVFVATLTYQFAQRVYPDSPLLQAMLLILFDIAAFSWFTALKDGAEGSIQRAVAGIMFVISLFAVGLVVAAETITGESAAMAGITVETIRSYATWAIVALAFLNTAASYIYYFVNPKNLKAMQEQAHLERQREHELKMAEFEMDMQEQILKETEKSMAHEAKLAGGEIAATIGAREMQAFYARLGVKKKEDGTFVLDTQWRDAPPPRLTAQPTTTDNSPGFRLGPNNRKGNKAWNLPGWLKKQLVTAAVCPACGVEAVMRDIGRGQMECQNCSAVLSLGAATPAPAPTANGNGHPNDPTQAP